MNYSGFHGGYGATNTRKLFSMFSAFLCVVCFLAGTVQAAAADFKTYDMMGFTWRPQQHSDNGLENILVLYECAMFYTEYVYGVNNCSDDNDTTPAIDVKDVIELRAMQTLQFSVPVVAIDIEGGDWELRSADPEVVDRAIKNWKDLIAFWQAINPVTKILIYGGIPRVAWELQTGDQEQINIYEQQAQKIASLFVNDRVALWPSAYVYYDSPENFRAERQWQIDICHRVYKTKCYFAIMPQYTDYFDSGTGFRLFMDQSSLLEIMTTLKEDGADGFGLWIDRQGLTDDYDDRRQAWSWAGGAMSTQRDKDLMWMSAVEKFLIANNMPDDEHDASYCVDSLILAAESSCGAKVAQRLDSWNWLKKFGR